MLASSLSRDRCSFPLQADLAAPDGGRVTWIHPDFGHVNAGRSERLMNILFNNVNFVLLPFFFLELSSQLLIQKS